MKSLVHSGMRVTIRNSKIYDAEKTARKGRFFVELRRAQLYREAIRKLL